MPDLTIPSLGEASIPDPTQVTLLASEIIDRTYSQYLYPNGENLPPSDTLTGSLTSGASSFVLSGDVQYVSDYSVVEIDYELIRTGNNSTTTVSNASDSKVLTDSFIEYRKISA